MILLVSSPQHASEFAYCRQSSSNTSNDVGYDHRVTDQADDIELDPALASRRYAKLINDLGSERGFRRGWMTDVAKVLGVHKSYVSLIRKHFDDETKSNRKLEIGLDVLQRAAENLQITQGYFFHVRAPDPSYTEYRISKPIMKAAEYVDAAGWTTVHLQGERHPAAETLSYARPAALDVFKECQPPDRELQVRDMFNLSAETAETLVESIMRLPIVVEAQQIRQLISAGGSAQEWQLRAYLLATTIEKATSDKATIFDKLMDERRNL